MKRPKVKPETNGKHVQPVNIAVVLPSMDVWQSGFGYDLANCAAFTSAALLQAEGADFSIQMHRSSLLPATRFELIKRGLEIKATHLMWFDTDMRFPKDTILRLLSHGKAMVGANYVERAVPTRPTSFKTIGWKEPGVPKTRCYTYPDSTGLEEVDSLGFGCVLMRMDVVGMVEPPGFEISFNVLAEGWTGEDCAFCKKYQEAGGTIYVDHDLSKEVRHIGQFEFRHDHVLDAPDKLIVAPEDYEHLELVP